MFRLLAALTLLATPTQAQTPNTPSGQAMAAIDMQAAEMLDVPLTGDADLDFVRAMVPQHQRAIELAEVVLTHGYSPEVRAMAEEVIATRRPQLEEMLVWLARHE
ncbi:DUF305 domain-containing protein [Pararhodobacter sp. CCB-MM2]|uniref:DUF305 domain-containing protein n=1 Tax=Pararhodobacter sp. CCB-MM2 TaxID=1786003 RepID=UPI00082B56C3|nr:DUF305 domain-containing protein [Pararhodobacter sp. CCB-MM2]